MRNVFLLLLALIVSAGTTYAQPESAVEQELSVKHGIEVLPFAFGEPDGYKVAGEATIEIKKIEQVKTLGDLKSKYVNEIINTAKNGGADMVMIDMESRSSRKNGELYYRWFRKE